VQLRAPCLSLNLIQSYGAAPPPSITRLCSFYASAQFPPPVLWRENAYNAKNIKKAAIINVAVNVTMVIKIIMAVGCVVSWQKTAVELLPCSQHCNYK
jgi:hypothetical protein